MAGLDGHHGLADWDLGGTAAEALITGLLTSPCSSSSVGESLLTSGAGLSCGWLGLGDKGLDGGECGGSGCLSGLESLGVLVELSLLACNDGSELLGLLALQCGEGGGDQCCLCGLVAELGVEGSGGGGSGGSQGLELCEWGGELGGSSSGLGDLGIISGLSSSLGGGLGGDITGSSGDGGTSSGISGGEGGDEEVLSGLILKGKGGNLLLVGNLAGLCNYLGVGSGFSSGSGD